MEGDMFTQSKTGLFRLSIVLLITALFGLSISGCIRKYNVKFDVYAPETLAQDATNYQ